MATTADFCTDLANLKGNSKGEMVCTWWVSSRVVISNASKLPTHFLLCKVNTTALVIDFWLAKKLLSTVIQCKNKKKPRDYSSFSELTLAQKGWGECSAWNSQDYHALFLRMYFWGAQTRYTMEKLQISSHSEHSIPLPLPLVAIL